MNASKFFTTSIDEYSKNKILINQTLDALSNLKFIEYDPDLISLGKEEDLFYELLFFLNIPKFISLDTDIIFLENINISNELEKIRFNLNIITKNKNIYKVLLHLHIFLLYKIENSTNLIIQKSEKLNSSLIYIKEINQSHQILIQILLILLKLYQEKKIDLNQIILFFNVIIIFINKNNNNNDNYLKVRNIIFLNLLIEKYFQYFFIFYRMNKKVIKMI